MDLLGLIRFGWIIRRIGAMRVARNTAAGSELPIVVRTIPVACPLPHIAGHIIEAIGIRREFRHRRNAYIAIIASIFIGEMPLMRISHPLAMRPEIIPPHEWLSGKTAACGELPLGFSWQSLACPLR